MALQSGRCLGVVISAHNNTNSGVTQFITKNKQTAISTNRSKATTEATATTNTATTTIERNGSFNQIQKNRNTQEFPATDWSGTPEHRSLRLIIFFSLGCQQIFEPANLSDPVEF